MHSTNRILIAGVGNLLLTDDGVGVHAVRELQPARMPGVTVADIGTATLHGLHFLESAERVLVIDAVRGGHPPGTIYLFDVERHTGRKPVASLHAMGLLEAARLLAPRQPPRMTVLGVEPASLEHGLELSPAVRAALPQLVDLAWSTVSQWLAEAATREALCLSAG